MSTPTAEVHASVRVSQFYKVYLDSMYYIEYYRVMRQDVYGYASHLDFLSALGAALGGGSGLGILASPWMAIPCGLITTASMVVSTAKQAYKWPEKISFCADMMLKYGAIYSKSKNLFDDVQATMAWTPASESLLADLRKEVDKVPVDKFREMTLAKRKKIQEDILRREEPQKWWKPSPAPTSPPQGAPLAEGDKQ